MRLYRKAAEAGNVDAQCNLACCYTAGTGVAVDMAEAVRWYRPAAEAGDANAQCALARCLREGLGVARDAAAAGRWLQAAAEQGLEKGRNSRSSAGSERPLWSPTSAVS